MKEQERSLSNTLVFEGLKSNFGGVLKELVFNGKFKSLPQDMIQSYLTRLALLKPGYWRIIGITIPKRGWMFLSLKLGGHVFITLTRIG